MKKVDFSKCPAEVRNLVTGEVNEFIATERKGMEVKDGKVIEASGTSRDTR